MRPAESWREGAARSAQGGASSSASRGGMARVAVLPAHLCRVCFNSHGFGASAARGTDRPFFRPRDGRGGLDLSTTSACIPFGFRRSERRPQKEVREVMTAHPDSDVGIACRSKWRRDLEAWDKYPSRATRTRWMTETVGGREEATRERRSAIKRRGTRGKERRP
jgi:hypothetical protein